jgi:hypothetical protein
MKLDNDSFLMNMNMVKLKGKKVLVQPSQAEMTKGKEVVIGEERPPRMIKPKSSKDDQWQKNEGGGGQATTSPKGHLQHPPGQVQGRQGRRQGARKSDHPESQIGQSGFPESGQHICSWELVRQVVSNPTIAAFIRLGASPLRLSSGAPLFCRATNAWAVGASADDVPTLFSLGGVVRSMGATTNALPLRMVSTCSGFWPWRLLRRRWLLRTHWISAEQRSFEAGKMDSPECQTGPSGFPGGNDSTWPPVGVESTQ